MYGFYGRILRVDLTGRTFAVENLSADIYEEYLGGKGLGTYLLLREVQPGTDPLSPDNRLIFTTGPATGTVLPGNSRYGVFSKSPLTGLYAESYAGGRVAPAMRRTGYDAVIVEGASAVPVYVEISDRGVRFHDASHLWGRDTYATEDAVLAEVGRKGAQAVVIGPAGENLVRFACLENNYWRSAGRTGMGAVMGSKKLKALVFHGESSCAVADTDLLQEVARRLRVKGKDNPGVKAYQTYGTTVMVGTMNRAAAFPARYWTAASDPQWENISGDTLLQRFEVKPRACPNCFMSCGKLTTVREGKFAGLQVEGPEYETLYAFGGLCGINNLEYILHLNDLCDRLGMDTITAGNLVGLMMEAGERGRVKGYPRYGDGEGAARLLADMAYGRGPGEPLARGIKHVAREMDLADLAIHVKGLEPPGYDPRVLKGMGLAYATSPRGACHLRATFYKPELSGMIDPSTTDGKAALFIEFENRLTVFNTMIFCVFFRDLIQWEDLVDAVRGTTGREYTREELARLAGRIVTATRLFNVREGATRADDMLPSRFFNEPVNDGQNAITRQELDIMLDDYYRLRGWDQNGLP
ncbi:aldehyde:ferredoxin oxidoreductase [Desulfofundulus thermobenzoicus]|uniref:Aldehyde:ferredoxin oxidoreductase n=1 Tax=Desulfofundulus thermobenzoicus TaxID=29376 RepID=A0A6N7IL73_9FIRM|nr:aldehyde ferredoxin oxidoreductase family protein [Desulfofundulus thermobenzoicus]MQL50726.1 aldehyde:ferredoxin oxidoreductase [Desulfofundulus thermobenzoicus]